MKQMLCKAMCRGTAIGTIYVVRKTHPVIDSYCDNVDYEIKRMHNARRKAVKQLEVLQQKALVEVGESDAAIFTAHKLILDDIELIGAIERYIRNENVSAEYAVNEVSHEFISMFKNMDDDYMKERALDIADVSERLINCIVGIDNSMNELDKPVIIVANDLTPSQTIQLDKSKILALVTAKGSVNSHTAILAKTMNIPALICADLDINSFTDGMEAIVDADNELFIIEPDEKLKNEAYAQQENNIKAAKQLEQLKGKADITKDGRAIELVANIGSLEDLLLALDNDARGVGLFRSEFLYIGRDSLPDEEEQFEVYKEAALRLDGKKLIIRTLDLGADKQVDYLDFGREDNPALGYRAIRICLTMTHIFKTQLRAIYRASAYGNISIMYPMIISVEEVMRIKEISAQVKAELDEEGIMYGDVSEGIMIETPAAAIISDELAKYVDFFSIGTNDLSQYTLAIDRQNSQIAKFYNPHHEAILRMIKLVVDNAHKEGIRVGICGELGADISLTESFIDMGIDEISVSPTSLLKVRKAIRDIK